MDSAEVVGPEGQQKQRTGELAISRVRDTLRRGMMTYCWDVDWQRALSTGMWNQKALVENTDYQKVLLT